MLALLSAIPGIGSIITFVVGKLFDSKVAITQAKLGADAAVATALVKASETAAHERTAALGIIAGNKLLTFLVIAFALPLVAYEWKVIAIDILWNAGHSSTDPIRGEVANWANTIIAFIFGAPAALGLGRMWFNRKSS